MGRGAAEGGEVEARGQFGERGSASTGCDVPSRASSELQGHRLDPRLAQRIDARRAEPLGQLALGRDEQRFMGEAADGAPSASNICSWTALNSVTWSSPRRTWVMRKIDVVDHRRQQIEPAAVGAADRRGR